MHSKKTGWRYKRCFTILRMKKNVLLKYQLGELSLDGGGEFDGVEADWFVVKSALSDNVDIESEISELADKSE